jgi:predicted RNase H-like nuclease (RuvC/YqgF family)
MKVKSQGSPIYAALSRLLEDVWSIPYSGPVGYTGATEPPKEQSPHEVSTPLKFLSMYQTALEEQLEAAIRGDYELRIERLNREIETLKKQCKEYWDQINKVQEKEEVDLWCYRCAYKKYPHLEWKLLGSSAHEVGSCHVCHGTSHVYTTKQVEVAAGYFPKLITPIQ